MVVFNAGRWRLGKRFLFLAASRSWLSVEARRGGRVSRAQRARADTQQTPDSRPRRRRGGWAVLERAERQGTWQGSRAPRAACAPRTPRTPRGGGGDGSGELMEGNGAVLLCGCRHPTPHTTTKRRERGIVLRQQLLATEYARDITGSERARRPANNARREREGVGEHRLSARTTTRDGSARNARSGSEKRHTIARA